MSLKVVYLININNHCKQLYNDLHSILIKVSTKRRKTIIYYTKFACRRCECKSLISFIWGWYWFYYWRFSRSKRYHLFFLSCVWLFKSSCAVKNSNYFLYTYIFFYDLFLIWFSIWIDLNTFALILRLNKDLLSLNLI